MPHFHPEDEVSPGSCIFIYGEAVARFASELEGWEGPLVPPRRAGAAP